MSNKEQHEQYNSAEDIVLSSLASLGGKQKSGTTYKLIVCPFHNDSKPSLSVNISNPKFPVGTFNCWSCPASGSWNKLADKLGFQKIKKWQLNEASSIASISDEDEQHMMGEKTESDYAQDLRVDIIYDWRENKTWRGFPGKLMQKLKAKFALDKKDDSQVLLLPILVGGSTVGYVKAAIEKKDGQLPYVSSKGQWIKDKGLFPYDYIKKVASKKGYVVLVEGPRDALRLIMEGIPALSVFGVQSFGVKKATLVTAIGDVTVYCMPDNDDAGNVLFDKAKEAFETMDVKLKRIKLPKKKDRSGKIIKVDPCSAPIELIENLKATLKDRHES